MAALVPALCGVPAQGDAEVPEERPPPEQMVNQPGEAWSTFCSRIRKARQCSQQEAAALAKQWFRKKDQQQADAVGAAIDEVRAEAEGAPAAKKQKRELKASGLLGKVMENGWAVPPGTDLHEVEKTARSLAAAASRATSSGSLQAGELRERKDKFLLAKEQYLSVMNKTVEADAAKKTRELQSATFAKILAWSAHAEDLAKKAQAAEDAREKLESELRRIQAAQEEMFRATEPALDAMGAAAAEAAALAAEVEAAGSAAA
jgi:hypothetical protein